MILFYDLRFYLLPYTHFIRVAEHSGLKTHNEWSPSYATTQHCDNHLYSSENSTLHAHCVATHTEGATKDLNGSQAPSVWSVRPPSEFRLSHTFPSNTLALPCV